MLDNVQLEQNARKSRGFYIVFFIFRLVFGGAFLESGLDKLIGGFDATGFLSHGTGPFAGFFAHLVPYVNIINPLVVWGEILIGLAFISGAFLRPAALAGAVEMIILYLPNLPPERGWISQQIVYMMVFIVFMFTGIGYFLGLDWFAHVFEERRHPLRIFFG